MACVLPMPSSYGHGQRLRGGRLDTCQEPGTLPLVLPVHELDQALHLHIPEALGSLIEHHE
jgi:hypothetical protein